MGRLEGKRAIVTAAAAGQGLATVRAYAREGAQVLATDIDGAALDRALADTPGVTTRVLDVSDPEAIKALAAEHGAPDILFNCAGWVHQGTILDVEEEDWDRSMTINVRSMYRMIRALLPGMLDQGGGTIVNMASVAGSIIGVPGRAVYGTTKAAVIGLTKAVAADFVARGIRCNCICPGTIDTPSLKDRMRALGGDYEAARASFFARQPTGRLGTPEEVAELVLFLSAPEAAFITGASYVIDGGWTNT